jgi:hypothetical protein
MQYSGFKAGRLKSIYFKTVSEKVNLNSTLTRSPDFGCCADMDARGQNPTPAADGFSFNH